jgi:hypothetical protein
MAGFEVIIYGRIWVIAKATARPMAPRIASGVPAAMQQARATIMTEMVERSLGDEEGEHGRAQGDI